jgi:YgiT-type zinc finger domain-containing protein
MENPLSKRRRAMNRCSIAECGGAYEKQVITHVVRHHGRVVVLDKVPAEVCRLCGDILLSIETVEAIERLLRTPGAPVDSAPIYEMPEAS